MKEQRQPINNSIKVGDIQLDSCTHSVDQLCGLVVWLLQQKEINDYLMQQKRNKLITGVG